MSKANLGLHKEKVIVFVVALALSFLLYGNSIRGDFVSDDNLIILQNPLTDGSLSNFFKAFSAPYYHNQAHAGLYRPLTIISFNLNKVFGDGPFGFHLFNIFLNALNGLFVFLLISKLISVYRGENEASYLKQKRVLTPYLAMVLFMFLPIHSEAVSAIAGRAELLSFLFSVWSFLFVLDKRYWIASFLLLAGLLSKETAAGFFLVFLYLWRFKEQKNLKQMFYNSLYFMPAVGSYAIIRLSVLGQYFAGVDHLMAYNPLRFAPFFDALWTSFMVFYMYLLKTAIPYQLSHDYSFNQIPIINNPFLHHEVYIGIVAVAVLVYIIFRKSTRNEIYGLAAVILLATYLPVSNWIIKIGTIMGERLMYMPSLGLVIMAALFITSKFKIDSKLEIKKSKLTFIGLVALFIWYGYVIIDRNKDWLNETALLTSGYEASPNSVISINNMAYLAFNDGKYREAIEWAEKALEVSPDHMPSYFLAGHAYKNLGNTEKPEDYWLKTVELSPTYTPAYLSLGILYYEQERLDEAEKVLAKGFSLERTWGKLFPLTLVKINRGDYDGAINLILANFGENPEKRELKFALGLAYLKKGDKIKAEFYLSQVKDSDVPIEEYFETVINQKVFKISEY